MKRERRVLGSIISGPIEEFLDIAYLDRLIFIERDNESARKTRAAALMYIGRNELGLTTSVKGNEVWILKHKDILDETIVHDLR